MKTQTYQKRKLIWKHKGRSVVKNSRNSISVITLLNARVKQFFAEDRSPFFQMQLPKHSHASARDGFNLTWNMEQPILTKETQPEHYKNSFETNSFFSLTAFERWSSASFL
jgi:hypothetical protein